MTTKYLRLMRRKINPFQVLVIAYSLIMITGIIYRLIKQY